METSKQYTAAERTFILCKFIEHLRAAKGLFPLSADQLGSAAQSWEPIIAGIGTGYFVERDSESLFAAAGMHGYTEARQIWDLWIAGTGGELLVNEEVAATTAQNAAAMRQPEPKGRNRQDLLAWLASKGVTEAQLSAAGAR